VVNLPPPLDRFFTDPATQARLSQFKFTESTKTRRAALQVTLPDRPNDQVAMDRAIPFFVLAIPAERAEEFGDLHTRLWTAAEAEKHGLGFVRLELIPRGKGKLLVRAPQLFHSIKPSESLQAAIDVVNEGTRRLDNVVVEIDPPLNWTKKVDPALVPTLAIGEEKRVLLTVAPPREVAVGRYELRLRTTALSDSQPVDAEDKTLTVEVQADASLAGAGLVVLLIAGLVAGLVVFGIRLSRR